MAQRRRISGELWRLQQVASQSPSVLCRNGEERMMSRNV